MAKRIKEKSEKINAMRDKRPQATAKYLRISPPKVRIVLDLIRGQDYYTALGILQSTPKAASELIIKVLESAGANAENNLNMSKSDLYVAECYANDGQTLKRYWYRSHGSADMLRKRTSHITIILDEKKEESLVTKPVAKTEKTAAKADKPAAKEQKPAAKEEKAESKEKSTKAEETTKVETKKASEEQTESKAQEGGK